MITHTSLGNGYTACGQHVSRVQGRDGLPHNRIQRIKLRRTPLAMAPLGFEATCRSCARRGTVYGQGAGPSDSLKVSANNTIAAKLRVSLSVNHGVTKTLNQRAVGIGDQRYVLWLSVAEAIWLQGELPHVIGAAQRIYENVLGKRSSKRPKVKKS